MDDALTPAPASLVRRIIARAWLARGAVEPVLGDVRLAAHQTEAAARLARTIDEFGGALLADEAGMGKTYVALAIARDHPSCTIVAPAALRAMWTEALKRAGVDAAIISFETLSRTGGAAPVSPALVIVDEAHHARNPRARRYAALARLTWGARVLLLSATPIHNRVRDVRALFALFLGSRASSLRDDEVARLVVRRTGGVVRGRDRLPDVEPVHWLGIDAAPEVLDAVLSLPPAVPAADGGAADALLRLGLIRAWSSSDAALRGMLRRRLHRAAALTAAMAASRWPTNAELRAWAVVDDAVQLAFPELVASAVPDLEVGSLARLVDAHVAGVRRLLRTLDESGDRDASRATLVRSLRDRHGGSRIVAFTNFADTARGLFTRLSRTGGVAVATSRGARIASGTIARREIVAQLDAGRAGVTDARARVDLLLATDVLSEGLNLHAASVLVHLDLPWTVARLEQRVGRLRRVGSPHRRVHVYAIGPPLHARGLVSVIRTLQRKARLAGALVGSPDLLIHEPLMGSRQLGGRRTAPPRDLAETVERLRETLQSWVPESGNRCPADGPSGTTAGRVAVAEVPALPMPWGALALCRTGGRDRLVAVEPGLVTESPRAVLRLARAVDGAVDPAPAATPVGAEPDIPDRARAVVLAWLAERRGAWLASPALAAPSGAHAAMLRFVEGARAGAPRHHRSRAAALASSCRARILAARGAGAEIALGGWLARSDTGASDPLARLTALAAWLATQVPPRTSPVDDQSTALLALLVVTREARPSGA
jgi:superfamily II DNA or RNA helicase